MCTIRFADILSEYWQWRRDTLLGTLGMVFKLGCLCIYGIWVDDAEIFNGVVYVFCYPSVRFNP